MYNVFTDFHHAGLLNSLILLFEKRLGGKVYRPIGMEWADNGYWALYDHPATRLQYLTYDQGYRPEDGTDPLNNIEEVEEGVYYCHDIASNLYNRAISLDTFLRMPIDIVIASIPQHIKPFTKLCERHPSHPKLIYQIGNAWNVNPTDQVRNVMASAKVSIPDGVHAITYHQEFDTHIFNYTDPVLTKNVTSLVNCFNTASIFASDWQTFTAVEHLLPEWNFKSYGGQCRDGAKHGEIEVAYAIKESRFIWHTKHGGDGYGHIVHNAGAIARPMIVRLSQYEGKLGGELMSDGETVINIDGLTPEQIATKIDYYHEPKNYERLQQNLRKRFRATVDFEAEATAIAQWVKMLQ